MKLIDQLNIVRGRGTYDHSRSNPYDSINYLAATGRREYLDELAQESNRCNLESKGFVILSVNHNRKKNK